MHHYAAHVDDALVLEVIVPELVHGLEDSEALIVKASASATCIVAEALEEEGGRAVLCCEFFIKPLWQFCYCVFCVLLYVGHRYLFCSYRFFFCFVGLQRRAAQR